MRESTRCIPLIIDPIELHLRLPVSRPSDRLLPDAGLTLPILRIL